VQRRIRLIETLAERRPLTKEWLMSRLAKLLRCEAGGSAIEYALVATIISIAAIVGMNNVGTKMNTMYGNVQSHL
jgi:Flp pilus assembly pilin Flp